VAEGRRQARTHLAAVPNHHASSHVKLACGSWQVGCFERCRAAVLAPRIACPAGCKNPSGSPPVPASQRTPACCTPLQTILACWLPACLNLCLSCRRERTSADTVNRQVGAEDEEALRQCVRRYFPGADGKMTRAAACTFTNTPDLNFILDRHPRYPQVGRWMGGWTGGAVGRWVP